MNRKSSAQRIFNSNNKNKDEGVKENLKNRGIADVRADTAKAENSRRSEPGRSTAQARTHIQHDHDFVEKKKSTNVLEAGVSEKKIPFWSTSELLRVCKTPSVLLGMVLRVARETSAIVLLMNARCPTC